MEAALEQRELLGKLGLVCIWSFITVSAACRLNFFPGCSAPASGPGAGMVCKMQPHRAQPCLFHHQFPDTCMHAAALFQVSPLCQTSRGNSGGRVGVHPCGRVAGATQKPVWAHAAARTVDGLRTPLQRLAAAVLSCRGAGEHFSACRDFMLGLCSCFQDIQPRAAASDVSRAFHRLLGRALAKRNGKKKYSGWEGGVLS